MRRKSVGILLAGVVLCISASPVLAGLVMLNDGQVHDIHSATNDDIRVDYKSPGTGTTVNILEAGVIGTLVGYEDSTINILGGSIHSLTTYGRSQVAVSGGLITYRIRAYENSQVDFSGGLTYNNLDAYGSSQVNVSGGSMVQLWARDNSQVAVSGGSMSEFLSTKDSSQVNVSGGSMSGLWAYDSSQVSVSGGSITNLGAWDTSQVNVSGGLIGRKLTISENAVLTIDGSDFAVDGTPVGYIEFSNILGGDYWTEPYRRLTGTLLSGEPINNDFQIGYSAKMVLVPEPATLLLLGTGGLMLRRRGHEVF